MKSVVLLSGGLDSTVLVADNATLGVETLAVTFDYGQMHRGREIGAARLVAAHYGIEHRIVGLASAFIPSALTGLGEIPETHADQPDASIVPGRNMVLISVGVSIADAMGMGSVFIGATAEDEAGYPDCRRPFISAVDQAAWVSTEGRVSVRAPYVGFTKREVIELGRDLGAPLELSWSCYRGGETPCNNCGACISRNEAMI